MEKLGVKSKKSIFFHDNFMPLHDMEKAPDENRERNLLKSIKGVLQLTKRCGLYIIKNNYCIQSAIMERQTGYDEGTDQPKGVCKD